MNGIGNFLGIEWGFMAWYTPRPSFKEFFVLRVLDGFGYLFFWFQGDVLCLKCLLEWWVF